MDGNNREQRKKRMIRQGIVPAQCDTVENMEFKIVDINSIGKVINNIIVACFTLSKP